MPAGRRSEEVGLGEERQSENGKNGSKWSAPLASAAAFMCSWRK